MDAVGGWRILKRLFIFLVFVACSFDSELQTPSLESPIPDAPTIPSAFSTSDCSWAEGRPSGLSRLESQTALISNKLYTFSGFRDGLLITPETEILDLNTGSWSAGAPMPVPVTHMGAAQVDGKVWIAGGFTGDHPGKATEVVQIYDSDTDTWTSGPALPSPRASGALVYRAGLLHYFGGLQPDRRTDMAEHLVLDVSDTASGWIKRADLPRARNHLGGLALNGKIYAVGGQFGHDGGVDDVALVDVYDPQQDTWQSLVDLPEDRSHFEPGIFSFEGRIFIVGGRMDDEYANDILVYDPKEGAWQSFCDLPAALLAPVARVHQDRLYVVNGGVEGVCCPVSTLQYIEFSQ